MRLLDANILMYASFDAFPQHVRTKKWLDAHLAALAIEHGLVMVSADSDFRLFPGLRIEDPTI